jgi:hypothetical protein
VLATDSATERGWREFGPRSGDEPTQMTKPDRGPDSTPDRDEPDAEQGNTRSVLLDGGSPVVHSPQRGSQGDRQELAGPGLFNPGRLAW